MPNGERNMPNGERNAGNDRSASDERNSFIRSLLGKFTFAFGRSMQAAGAAPRGQGKEAAMGAAFAAPFELQELLRQREQDELQMQLQASAAQRQQQEQERLQRTQDMNMFNTVTSTLAAQPSPISPEQNLFSQGPAFQGTAFPGMVEGPPLTLPGTNFTIPGQPIGFDVNVPESLQSMIGLDTVNVAGIDQRNQMESRLRIAEAEAMLPINAEGTRLNEIARTSVNPIQLPANVTFEKTPGGGTIAVLPPSSLNEFVTQHLGPEASAEDVAMMAQLLQGKDARMINFEMQHLKAQTELAQAEAANQRLVGPDRSSELISLQGAFRGAVNLERQREIADNVALIMDGWQTPSNDFALVAAAAKITDPTGAVRAGESDAILSAVSGILPFYRESFSRALEGGTLTQPARNALRNWAVETMEARYTGFTNIVNQWVGSLEGATTLPPLSLVIDPFESLLDRHSASVLEWAAIQPIRESLGPPISPALTFPPAPSVPEQTFEELPREF
jgi:hypothetical protein